MIRDFQPRGKKRLLDWGPQKWLFPGGSLFWEPPPGKRHFKNTFFLPICTFFQISNEVRPNKKQKQKQNSIRSFLFFILYFFFQSMILIYPLFSSEFCCAKDRPRNSKNQFIQFYFFISIFHLVSTTLINSMTANPVSKNPLPFLSTAALTSPFVGMFRWIENFYLNTSVFA